jgi:hypothetical protein
MKINILSLKMLLTLSIFFSSFSATAYSPETQDETHQEYLNEFIGLCNGKNFGFHASTNAASLMEYISLGNLLYTTPKIDYIFFRLLTNRLKGCDAEIIMTPVLEMFLEQLPLNISRHYTNYLSWNDRLNRVKSKINSLLSNRFETVVSQIYNMGRIDTAQSVTNELFGIINADFVDPLSEKHEDYWKSRLQRQVHTLLELSIQRLMWDSNFYEGVWETTNKLAFGLYRLANAGIIDHSDYLDDLLCSLVNRFIYFLKLTGGHYPSSFYANIEYYIANGISSWIDFEVDSGIRTKKSLLLEEVFNQKMKALAYERNGILS